MQNFSNPLASLFWCVTKSFPRERTKNREAFLFHYTQLKEIFITCFKLCVAYVTLFCEGTANYTLWQPAANRATLKTLLRYDLCPYEARNVSGYVNSVPTRQQAQIVPRSKQAASRLS